MDNKKIDQLIKKKLETGGGAIPSKPQWDLIASKINVIPPVTKKKPMWIPWALAAALAGVAFLGLHIFWKNSPQEISNPDIMVKTEVDDTQSTLQPIEEIDTDDVQDVLLNATPKAPVKNLMATHTEVETIKTNHASNNTTSTHPIDSKTTIIEETLTNIITNIATKNDQIEETKSWVEVQHDPTPQESTEWNFANTDHKSSKKQFSLGFSGAVNYGNQNSGYVLALSARQDLSSKVFIDGAVSMIYNNSSNQVIGLPNSLQNVTMSSAPVKSAMAREVVSYMPSVNTLYLQFNPVIGYKIVDDISISAGPDVQKLMNQNSNNNTFNYYTFKTDGTIGQLPDLDVGLTTQTEVNLSPSLKAGLLYRQGFNHLIAPNTMNVINRNYFQFQFKYSIGMKSEK